MTTFPRKLLDRWDALSYMWSSGGISFRLLLVLGIILTSVAALTGVPSTELVLLVLVLLLCAGLEIGNTVLEILLDIFRPYHDPRIKRLKDLTGTLPALVAVAYMLLWSYFVFGG